MAEPDRSSTDGTPENEVDSGTQPESAHSNEDGCDQENEADQSGGQGSPVASGGNEGALNTNYDSSDGAIPIHRCDRCDNYETLSRSAFLTHLSSCSVNEGESSAADRSHDRKLFQCDVCNMKFSNGANMRRHKMRHTGVKPYECRVCQKRFFRKDHLAEHFTTHTKTLPYHCPICNRGFQRQIAMRAHFQNEHVGQHDMIKSCPLCSYRAGSMKSLRVHFFNRHGIDLDNPGPGTAGASSVMQAGHCSPMEMTCGVSVAATYSDSGDSVGARSIDNATPPMHFLTPHVEISMADAPTPFSPSQCEQPLSQSVSESQSSSQHLNGDCPCPGSPHSADSNSNAPSSSHNGKDAESVAVAPSISLIPIKQEPVSAADPGPLPVNLSTTTPDGQVHFQSASSTGIPSLVKVSPLKSLLRDDLKRKITVTTARPGSQPRCSRPLAPSPHPESTASLPFGLRQGSGLGTVNGTITSTGTDQPPDSAASTVWRPAPLRRGTGIGTPSSALQCVFCGIAFPDQTLYFLHKGCHSDSNPWKCNICGEQCSNVYEFNSHLLSKTHQ
ncbi:zinc finger protein sdz-12 [Schistocerca americana]|uniref:zinc finger protein sdz-12 n=1 Tax=Schistocerca americana TaxID=7009 RepID=UPI001F4FECF5|nr:zinc finger protein sdz-12 [Schistocerca americana]XP_047112585.1 zinc finger protein sdz-12-like [Schistocerca piceifrons]XP_049956201.1 zinc finger protein sdz-12 [Schistocerca serialis cubense]